MSGEVPGRTLKRHLPAIYRRLTRSGDALSPEARLALIRVLDAAAADEELPSQRALAGELGLTEKALREAMKELVRAGLVVVERRGSRPSGYQLAVAGMLSWVSSGDLPRLDSRVIVPPVLPDYSGRIDRTSPAKTAGQRGGGLPHGLDLPPYPPIRDFDGDDGIGLDEELQRRFEVFKSSLNRAGIRTPYTVQQSVRGWANDERVSLELWQDACTTAARQGVPRLAYVEAIVLRALLGGEETVVRFEDYRPLAGGAR
jgi:biotin operon repressor